MEKPMAFTVVSTSEIPDGGASEARLDPGDPGSSVVLLRRGDRVYAYRNLCPHAGRFLNWAPGRFLMDAGRLVCAAHGAVFEIEDGRCVDGPCRGSSLVPLAVTGMVDGQVRISD
jgi:nitrite reductase/ring-hydroxylating ferredoxin subunit